MDIRALGQGPRSDLRGHDLHRNLQFTERHQVHLRQRGRDGIGISYCGVGGKAVYSGETPTKDEANNEGTITRYTFKGWDKTLRGIQADTTFIAQYEESTYYVCKFLDWDSTLLKEVVIKKNRWITCALPVPVREPVTNGSMVTNYLFSSWDTNADFTISSPTTFTAQYTSETYEGYVVTFNDLASNKLASAGAPKNGTATYPTSYKEIVDMCYSYDAENVTMFVGWDKSLDNVTSSMTVTAQTKTISRKQNGEYPQADVNDWELCSKLDNLTTADAQGYYEYNGEKYYEFSEWRYKKVEPIKWRYMSDKGNGVKEFIADGALDRRSWNESDEDYEDGSHANNYAKSDIREWLNNEFVTRAFYYDQSLVQTAVVDNSSKTTDSSGGEYACEDTTDMAYLPSYSQIMNHENGFVSADTSTDEDGDVLGWWTRSPGLSPSSAIAKYRGTQNNGLGIKTAIRPCIQLKIS